MAMEAAHLHVDIPTNTMSELLGAETSSDACVNCLTHKCADNIVCTQTLACNAVPPSWQLAEWGPDWFSTAAKRLTSRNFAPEPTPPIS